MLSASTNDIASRTHFEKSRLSSSSADVIDIDDDSQSSTSLKRRRLQSPLISSSKCRSVSHDYDSDVAIIENCSAHPLPNAASSSRRTDYESTSPTPTHGQHIFNRLTNPEVHLAKSKFTSRVNLDGGALREQFLQNLQILGGPKVTVFNDIDHTSPPSKFQFINNNVLGEDVTPAPPEWVAGCNCRKDNGRHMGCEYLSCECVQLSDPDKNGRLHFPYSGAAHDYGCLRGVYLKLRNHIYECNDRCNCDKNCKNRLVQHGRQIPLEIFKTLTRGWGLRCPVDLLKGQFIDTYRGEVITNEESNRRGLERARDLNTDNYLFGLDKFCEPQTITKAEFKANHPDKKTWHRAMITRGDYRVTTNAKGKKLYLNPNYVDPIYSIDSKNMGGPTRFINHSCDPNCAIYTVSYNHADVNLYDVAFFTIEDIFAGTELTFDYKDDDDRRKITDAMADKMEKENGERPIKCLCGAAECRGYFFHS